MTLTTLITCTGMLTLGTAWLRVAHKAETKRAAELVLIRARVRSLDKAD